MSDHGHTYDFAALDKKWQAYWAVHKTFRVPNPGEPGFDDSNWAPTPTCSTNTTGTAPFPIPLPGGAAVTSGGRRIAM